jgi:hypothetical protein
VLHWAKGVSTMQLFYHWSLVLLVAVSSGHPPPTQSYSQAATQNPAAQEAQAPAVKAGDLPVDMGRIQRALANTPKLRFDKNERPVFRVEVFGEKPTIDDILGPDWSKGPVPYGGMTHQEFLDMVTPKDVQGYAAFSNKQAATVAATSFLLQWTLQKAIAKYRTSQDERERETARQEVLDALKELEAARAKAGLPRK